MLPICTVIYTFHLSRFTVFTYIYKMLVHINKMQRDYEDMKKTRDFSWKNVLLYSVVHLCCTKKNEYKAVFISQSNDIPYKYSHIIPRYVVVGSRKYEKKNYLKKNCAEESFFPFLLKDIFHYFYVTSWSLFHANWNIDLFCPDSVYHFRRLPWLKHLLQH